MTNETSETVVDVFALPEPPFWVSYVSKETARNVHIPGGPTVVMGYGQELLVDQGVLDLNPQMAERIEAGEFALGRWEEATGGSSRLIEGSLAWAEARENARRAAHAIADQDERRMALARFRAEWGEMPTSRTLMTVTGADRSA